MIGRWIFIFILIPYTLLAEWQWEFPDTIVITSDSLPYQIKYRAHVYLFDAGADSIMSDGNGLLMEYSILTVDSVRIDGQHKKLLFGADNSNGHYGLRLTGLVEHVQVSNMTIYHFGDNGSNACQAVKMEAPQNILFDSVNTYITGTNGRNWYEDGSQKSDNHRANMIEIGYGWDTSDVVGYTSRCTNDAAMFVLGGADTLAVHDYTFKVHDRTLGNAPHVGIYVGSNGNQPTPILLYSLDITVDARNNYYDSLGGEGTCSGGNAYGIFAVRWKAGSIYDNTITSGTNHGGGRGIALEHMIATGTDTIEVYDNIADVHCGPDGYFATGSCYALRVRWGLHNLNIHDNQWIATSDTAEATRHTGLYARGVSITMDEEALANHFECYDDWILARHFLFSNNLCRGVTTDTDSGAIAYGATFEIDDSLEWDDRSAWTIWIEDNTKTEAESCLVRLNVDSTWLVEGVDWNRHPTPNYPISTAESLKIAIDAITDVTATRSAQKISISRDTPTDSLYMYISDDDAPEGQTARMGTWGQWFSCAWWLRQQSDVLWPDSITWQNNRIESNYRVARLGDINEGCTYWEMVGDTFDYEGTVYDNAYTFEIGFGEKHCIHNWIRDGVFEGGTSDDSTEVLWRANPSGDSLGQEILFQRTLVIRVEDGGGTPVESANVWAVNAYGDTVLNAATDAQGHVENVVNYLYDAYDGPYYPEPYQDSTAYNDFTLKAKKGTDSTTTTLTISSILASDTLILSIASAVEIKGIDLKGLNIRR